MFSTKRRDLLHDRIAALESQVDALRVDLAEARGRLANAPSAFQILSWVVGIGVAAVGLAIAVARVM